MLVRLFSKSVSNFLKHISRSHYASRMSSPSISSPSNTFSHGATRNVTSAAIERGQQIKKATVLGGGAFGSAMAQVLGRKGIHVTMWVYEPEVCEEINKNHTNAAFLPNFKLNKHIHATNDFEQSLKHTELILIVIPTPFLRDVVCTKNSFLPVGVPMVCCTKGIENESLLTPFEILVEELPGKYHSFLSALSGPSFAIEVAKGIPTSVLVAANNPEVATIVQHAMSDMAFRVFTGSDIIGAEVCGAIKNVIAIACGASEGLGLGSNSQAMLITRGLSEITRLAVKKGAHPSTMSGLAGLGDLVLTCTSTQSRNYTVGMRLAKGEKMKDITASMKMVAEGVKTSKSAKALAEQLDVHLPLCDEVYKALFEDKPMAQAMFDLAKLPLEEEFNPYQHYKEVKEELKAINNGNKSKM